MNTINKIEKTTTEDIKELAEMLELANGILGNLPDLTMSDFDVEGDEDEFDAVCSAWADGHDGWETYSNNNDVTVGIEEVPSNMLYNLQDNDWLLGKPAYSHSRDIVNGGDSAYDEVMKLYKTELRALCEEYDGEFTMIEDCLDYLVD